MTNTRPENFMPLWIADYLADTMHLTARQHGQYLLLLMFSWKQDRPLPKADAALRAIARASESEWAEDKHTVLAFFTEGQDGFRQKRLEEERADAVRRFNSLKARSAAGVAARQHKAGATEPEVEPKVEPKVTLGADTTHNSHISKDIKHMSGPDGPDVRSADFEAFWKAYPRSPNMSKAAAWKSWRAQKSQLPPLPSLLAAVAKYRAFLDAETRKRGREYPAKHAQGWLTERRWEGYLQADESPAKPVAHVRDWADDIPAWQAFKASLPPAEWQVWFAMAKPNGSPSTLVVPSSFARDKIDQVYGDRLYAHFGDDFALKVAPP